MAKLTIEDKIKIINLYKDGFGNHSIAEKLKISSSRIRQILRIFLSIFGVFFSSTIKYIFNWFRNCSVEESIYAGYQIGYYGIVGIILVDPIIGIMYFFNKKLIKHDGSGNIVMVGWYIQ